jgi:NADH-quinone oxidoreductase subunit N
VGSFLGLYFYLRVIQRMFMTNRSVAVASPSRGAALARVGGFLCLAATAAFTIVPGWILSRM